MEKFGFLHLECSIFDENLGDMSFLNQVCTGLQPAHTWFLKIALVCMSAYVSVCMCVRPKGINSNIWSDIHRM